jgi:hypothetical protein
MRVGQIVAGAPGRGRYALFGTLFARHNVDGSARLPNGSATHGDQRIGRRLRACPHAFRR